jgi:integrase
LSLGPGEIPTRDEISALLQASSGFDVAFIAVAALAGLRSSEIRGLRWQDVDFEARVFKIRQRADRYGRIGSCKSKGSRRDIPVGDRVLNALRLWRAQAGEFDLVFATSTGKPIQHGNLVYRFWQPLQVRVFGEIKHTGLHCLRHFYASWLINSKKRGGLELPVKEVQKRMGHASVTLTMDVYAKLFEARDRESEQTTMTEAEESLFAVA